MINAYLASFPSLYEGEDIEVRYRIFEDQELLCQESIWMEYQKPAIVGQIALITLLKALEKYRDQEIVIRVNDPVLNEIIRGTYTTKNKDVLQMARVTRDAFSQFKACGIQNVSTDPVELAKWSEILKPSL